MPYERNWRDADACACLHDLGASAFAWEFLRRNCAYRAAPPKCPNGWRINGGCDFAADPSLGADRACVVWLPHIDPTTVVVGPAPDDARSAK
jgi:Proteobacterial transcriptional regulator-like domain